MDGQDAADGPGHLLDLLGVPLASGDVGGHLQHAGAGFPGELQRQPAGAIVIFFLTLTSLSGLGMMSAGVIMISKHGDPIGFLWGVLSGLLSGVYYPHLGVARLAAGRLRRVAHHLRSSCAAGGPYQWGLALRRPVGAGHPGRLHNSHGASGALGVPGRFQPRFRNEGQPGNTGGMARGSPDRTPQRGRWGRRAADHDHAGGHQAG